jgi:hypothetical protein
MSFESLFEFGEGGQKTEVAAVDGVGGKVKEPIEEEEFELFEEFIITMYSYNHSALTRSTQTKARSKLHSVHTPNFITFGL